MIDTAFWFMFPVGIFIATIAMMAGIGGAILFAPFMIIVLKLDPLVALATGLLIEVFGFSSGIVGYWRQKSINFGIVRKLIIFTMPATILGVVLARFVPSVILRIILGLLIVSLGYEFIFSDKKCQPKHPHHTGHHKKHTVPKLGFDVKILSSLGGFFVGMVSSGLGEINEYNFLEKLKLPVASASGTSVFLVAASAFVGVIAHAYFLVQESQFYVVDQVLPLVIFAIPGVIIGGQIGVRIAKNISITIMEYFVGGLFMVVGLISLLGVA